MKYLTSINRIINKFVAVAAGAIAGSLWIRKTDNWEIYLPIVLLLISLKFILDEIKVKQ